MRRLREYSSWRSISSPVLIITQLFLCAISIFLHSAIAVYTTVANAIDHVARFLQVIFPNATMLGLIMNPIVMLLIAAIAWHLYTQFKRALTQPPIEPDLDIEMEDAPAPTSSEVEPLAEDQAGKAVDLESRVDSRKDPASKAATPPNKPHPNESCSPKPHLPAQARASLLKSPKQRLPKPRVTNMSSQCLRTPDIDVDWPGKKYVRPDTIACVIESKPQRLAIWGSEDYPRPLLDLRTVKSKLQIGCGPKKNERPSTPTKKPAAIVVPEIVQDEIEELAPEFEQSPTAPVTPAEELVVTVEPEVLREVEESEALQLEQSPSASTTPASQPASEVQEEASASTYLLSPEREAPVSAAPISAPAQVFLPVQDSVEASASVSAEPWLALPGLSMPTSAAVPQTETGAERLSKSRAALKVEKGITVPAPGSLGASVSSAFEAGPAISMEALSKLVSAIGTGALTATPPLSPAPVLNGEPADGSDLLASLITTPRLVGLAPELRRIPAKVKVPAALRRCKGDTSMYRALKAHTSRPPVAKSPLSQVMNAYAGAARGSRPFPSVPKPEPEAESPQADENDAGGAGMPEATPDDHTGTSPDIDLDDVVTPVQGVMDEGVATSQAPPAEGASVATPPPATTPSETAAPSPSINEVEMQDAAPVAASTPFSSPPSMPYTAQPALQADFTASEDVPMQEAQPVFLPPELTLANILKQVSAVEDVSMPDASSTASQSGTASRPVTVQFVGSGLPAISAGLHGEQATPAATIGSPPIKDTTMTDAPLPTNPPLVSPYLAALLAGMHTDQAPKASNLPGLSTPVRSSTAPASSPSSPPKAKCKDCGGLLFSGNAMIDGQVQEAAKCCGGCVGAANRAARAQKKAAEAAAKAQKKAAEAAASSSGPALASKPASTTGIDPNLDPAMFATGDPSLPISDPSPAYEPDYLPNGAPKVKMRQPRSDGPSTTTTNPHPAPPPVDTSTLLPNGKPKAKPRQPRSKNL